MVRSVRIVGKFLSLGLLSVALAAPLGAEEITVTIPPDDPPAQAQTDPSLPTFAKPVSDSNDATAHPTDSAAEQTAQPAPSAPPEAPTQAAPAQPDVQAQADATPPPPPVMHKAKKKAVAAAPASPAADAADASAKPAQPVKATKTAKSSCLNLTQDACGGNSECIWVAAGTNDAGKATKARCRSLAILKKETDKVAKAAAKAAATGGPEVLPWASKASTTSSAPATTATVDTKPAKKVHTAAKKAKPKPEAAPSAAAATETAPDAGGSDQGSAAGATATGGGAD